MSRTPAPAPVAGHLTAGGTQVPFVQGQSIGAALWAAGVRAVRHHPVTGEPRGMFCGIGVCFDCLATVDGVAEVRLCRTPARDGTVVDLPPAAPAGPTPEESA